MSDALELGKVNLTPESTVTQNTSQRLVVVTQQNLELRPNPADLSKREQALADRLAEQEIALASLQETVRGLCEAQSRWTESLDEVLDILLAARALSFVSPAARVKR